MKKTNVKKHNIAHKKADTCPICGKPIGEYPALSRKDNLTSICSECGTAEALEDWSDRKR
jgi:RNA polymerase subunit RPABC4/transcription elongation factor Spt4